MVRDVNYEQKFTDGTRAACPTNGGSRSAEPRSPSAATGAGLRGEESTKNMRFCETNPNYDGAFSDVTARGYGICGDSPRNSIRVRLAALCLFTACGCRRRQRRL